MHAKTPPTATSNNIAETVATAAVGSLSFFNSALKNFTLYQALRFCRTFKVMR